MNKKEALSKVQSICSRQEQCRQDISLKLSKLDIGESDANQILDILEQEGFIDHGRYARSFVMDKFKLNKWGRIKIRWMLRQKGISEDIIEMAIAQMDEDEYESLIKAELQKKYRSLKSHNESEKKAKLIQFASQRGFEYEIIYKVIHKL